MMTPAMVKYTFLSLYLHIGYAIEYRSTNGVLTEFPTDVPSEATIINLHHNQISNLYPSDFDHIGNLRELYMYNNFLTSWPDIGSRLKPNLERMHLGANMLSEVTANQTADHFSLQHILLYRNQITEFPDFGDAKKNLVLLIIANNRIKYIDRVMFKGMSKLTQLHLHGNLLAEMPDFYYLNFTNFISLTMENNPIQVIFPWAMGKLEAIPASVVRGTPAVSCDCHAVYIAQFMHQHPGTGLTVTCDSPDNVQGLQVHVVTMNQFVCPGKC